MGGNCAGVLALALGALTTIQVFGAAGTAVAQSAEAEMKTLTFEQIRARLKALDGEHTAALEDEDFDKAYRLLREIGRLDEELIRRELATPPERPPEPPRPPR